MFNTLSQIISNPDFSISFFYETLVIQDAERPEQFIEMNDKEATELIKLISYWKKQKAV